MRTGWDRRTALRSTASSVAIATHSLLTLCCGKAASPLNDTVQPAWTSRTAMPTLPSKLRPSASTACASEAGGWGTAPGGTRGGTRTWSGAVAAEAGGRMAVSLDTQEARQKAARKPAATRREERDSEGVGVSSGPEQPDCWLRAVGPDVHFSATCPPAL